MRVSDTDLEKISDALDVVTEQIGVTPGRGCILDAICGSIALSYLTNEEWYPYAGYSAVWLEDDFAADGTRSVFEWGWDSGYDPKDGSANLHAWATWIDPQAPEHPTIQDARSHPEWVHIVDFSARNWGRVLRDAGSQWLRDRPIPTFPVQGNPDELKEAVAVYHPMEHAMLHLAELFVLPETRAAARSVVRLIDPDLFDASGVAKA